MTVQRSIRIDDERWDRWKRAAAVKGVSVTTLIRDAVDGVAEAPAAAAVRADDARRVRERLRATMAGVCVHGFPAGVCLRPECKGVK